MRSRWPFSKGTLVTGLLGLVGLYLLIVVTVAASSTKIEDSPAGPEQAKATPAMNPKSTVHSEKPLRTLWFGHSLLQYRAAPDEDVPAIDIPQTVDAIHEQARKIGRSQRPPGITVSYYDGPFNLGYWVHSGGAAEKIKAAEQPLDFVIGVGFMHLVPQKGGHLKFRSRTLAPPNLVDNLKGALKDALNVATFGRSDAREVEQLTQAKYDLIKIVSGLNSQTTWLNYVAPVMSDRPENQPSVDARFACIAEAAQKSGDRALNVPVGQAFRAAERKASLAGIGLPLQRADRLHYTALGAYLASNVFFSYLYQIDPRGLPLPNLLASHLDRPENQAQVALIQETAWETVNGTRADQPAKCGWARLPIDEAFVVRRQ